MNSSLSLHILFVEDNDLLREATAAFLEDQGHRVTSLYCTEDVDITPTPSLPDVYLIDVNLPGENGFSLAERIRQAHSNTGIVLMTARGQLQDRLEEYHSGADNYLTNPVAQTELLACINSLGQRVKSAIATTEAPSLKLNSQNWWMSGPKQPVLLSHGEGLLPANLEMRIIALRKKLSSCGAPEDTIRTIRGHGYALSIPIKVV